MMSPEGQLSVLTEQMKAEEEECNNVGTEPTEDIGSSTHCPPPHLAGEWGYNGGAGITKRRHGDRETTPTTPGSFRTSALLTSLPLPVNTLRPFHAKMQSALSPN